MKQLLNWRILLGVFLLLLSVAFYMLHYFLFHDAHHIFIYLVGDVAFVFIEVLLVTMIIHHLLNEWDKRSKLNKLNMVIETFFSEFGKPLMAYLSSADTTLSTKGNPPALPGDLRSLTVPGVNESLPSVNRSKFSEKEAFDETHPKPKSFGLGLQVPRCLDTQVSPKGAVWSDSATSWGGHPRVGPATRESGVGRTFVR